VVVEGDAFGAERPRSRGDQDDAPPKRALTPPSSVTWTVRAEPRLAVHELDRVTVEVRRHLVRHRLDDAGCAGSELRDRRLGIQRETEPVHLSPTETGDVQGRFAQRLARDLAGLDHRSARRGGAFDNGHPVPEVGRLRRRLLPGRAGADDDNVESILLPHLASRKQTTPRTRAGRRRSASGARHGRDSARPRVPALLERPFPEVAAQRLLCPARQNKLRVRVDRVRGEPVTGSPLASARSRPPGLTRPVS
jgi:hypothetical protein